MTNHDIIKIVNFVLNKDINGNAYSAAEFTSMINAQSLSLFYEKLGLTKEYQLDAPIARTGVGVSKKLTHNSQKVKYHSIAIPQKKPSIHTTTRQTLRRVLRFQT